MLILTPDSLQLGLRKACCCCCCCLSTLPDTVIPLKSSWVCSGCRVVGLVYSACSTRECVYIKLQLTFAGTKVLFFKLLSSPPLHSLVWLQHGLLLLHGLWSVAVSSRLLLGAASSPLLLHIVASPAHTQDCYIVAIIIIRRAKFEFREMCGWKEKSWFSDRARRDPTNPYITLELENV